MVCGSWELLFCSVLPVLHYGFLRGDLELYVAFLRRGVPEGKAGPREPNTN